MRSVAANSVALAHHWLTTMRGGEKVLAELADLFPAAPIYTLVARRDRLSPALAERDIRTSWLQRLAMIPDVQRKALPLLPGAARSIDATTHDVVIVSDAAIMKAIRTRHDAIKICYCHSPMRYVWDLYDEYIATAGPVGRMGLRLCAKRVRERDREAAQSVTAFIANSVCVAERIRRCYGRESVVIPPPVETTWADASTERASRSEPSQPAPPDEPFYLVVSEHVHYKRTDLAIEACNRLRSPLVVIGAGPLLSQMRRLAGPTVRLLGWQSDAVVREHMRRCRALLFCGLEDFGMVPVEVQAAGKPVIAYAAGGALETVVADGSGVFFAAQTPDAVVDAIRRFESTTLWSPQEIRAHARQFSVDAFRRKFTAFYEACVGRHAVAAK